jgi:hypothetical protein
LLAARERDEKRMDDFPIGGIPANEEELFAGHVKEF